MNSSAEYEQLAHAVLAGSSARLTLEVIWRIYMWQKAKAIRDEIRFAAKVTKTAMSEREIMDSATEYVSIEEQAGNRMIYRHFTEWALAMAALQQRSPLFFGFFFTGAFADLVMGAHQSMRLNYLLRKYGPYNGFHK